MSASDYYRPSRQQIHKHFKCLSCGNEIEASFDERIDKCDACGDSMQYTGESYPGNPNEWGEERDSPSGKWRTRRR